MTTVAQFDSTAPKLGLFVACSWTVRGVFVGPVKVGADGSKSNDAEHSMITRISFDPDFAQAIRVRGLTLTEVAQRAGVTVATASSAVHCRPINVTTAVKLARVVAAASVVPELEVWARAPEPPDKVRQRAHSV